MNKMNRNPLHLRALLVGAAVLGLSSIAMPAAADEPTAGTVQARLDALQNIVVTEARAQAADQPVAPAAVQAVLDEADAAERAPAAPSETSTDG